MSAVILFDEIEPLVRRYKQATSQDEKDKLFSQIAEANMSLISWVSNKSKWLERVNELDVDAVISDITLRLPKILEDYNDKKSWFSYFVRSIENRFVDMYRHQNVVARFSGEWPVDEDGVQYDMPDNSTMMHNSSSTQQEKSVDFERSRFFAPLEIGDSFPQPYQNLVRFIANRFLDRADNKEKLFINDLANETSQLPMATEFKKEELQQLVRLTIAAVRSKLYSLREDMTDEECDEYLGKLLENGDPKIWPILGVFSSRDTIKLLHCLSGILPGIPTHSKLIKK